MKSLTTKYLLKQRFSYKVVSALHQIRIYEKKLRSAKEDDPIFFHTLNKPRVLKNHSREEEKNYFHASDYIDVYCTSHSDRFLKKDLTLTLIKKLHKTIYPNWGGTFKRRNNRIKAPKKYQYCEPFICTPAYLTQKYMTRLQHNFQKRWKEQKMDPLLLIAAYILDFLRIHPFLDGNGRLSRLLIRFLLYQGSYEIAKWIDLEQKICQSKSAYFFTLRVSILNWRKGTHDLNPWCEYLTGILLSAYQDIFKLKGF